MSNVCLIAPNHAQRFKPRFWCIQSWERNKRQMVRTSSATDWSSRVMTPGIVTIVIKRITGRHPRTYLKVSPSDTGVPWNFRPPLGIHFLTEHTPGFSWYEAMLRVARNIESPTEDVPCRASRPHILFREQCRSHVGMVFV